MLLERVEVLPERVEELLSRLTVVVRPDASVVFTVVRVVPLLLTLVWIVVEGADERVVVVVVLVERAEVPPVLVVEAAVVVELDDLVELVVLEELVELGRTKSARDSGWDSKWLPMTTMSAPAA